MNPSLFLRLLAVLAALLSGAATMEAGIRLGGPFTDHMVLQREVPVPIWGTADPGEEISVRFRDQTKTARADDQGRWRIDLDPESASAEGRPLKITGSASPNPFILEDVLVGEVWLCSGQSNMEKPLGEKRGQRPTFNFEEELQAAHYPQIRLLNVANTRAAAPANSLEGAWTPCSPETLDAIKFSAVGYFFGRKLHTELEVPVGLIDATWGGTRIEPWTAPEGFESVPSLAEFAAAARTPGAKVEGTTPGTLYNGMIAPLVPFALRGAIWYQGESNVIEVDDGMRYADKMTALVRGWRKVWQNDFSFYYVQIAPHLYHVVRPLQVSDPMSAPRLWEAQAAAMQLPRTGMIVTTDLADDLMDIHPRDKRTVGERLARWALAKDYGRNDVIYSGPVYQKMEVEGDRAILHFDPPGGGLASRDEKPLRWFVVAGEDGRFYPGNAVIEEDQVVVTSPHVAEPTVVRFAWDEAAQPNLVNQAGLPAVPFRTDAVSWTPPAE